MQAHSLQNILTHLRKLTDPQRPRELSDKDLLDRFLQKREEAAFTLLVQRHGPMVFGVCRRILGDSHAAEDALQATFLTLVRYAHSIRKKQSLSSWLHSVAARLCYKVRMRTARQRQIERVVPPRPKLPDPCETLATQQLRETLDNEINRLPDKYRVPLVLCYLAEKTHEEAARELGWPKSSVTARLARARELLQRRLMQRGFTVSAGLVMTLMMEPSANSTLPTLVTLTTVRRAVQAVNNSRVAETTATLVNSVLKGGSFSKWIMGFVLLGTLGLSALVANRLPSVGRESEVGETPTQQTVAHLSHPKSETQPKRLDRFGDPLPEEALARMGSSRLRQGGYTRTLAFSPDGKMLASVAENGLCLWDRATGKLRRRLDVGKANWSLAFVFTSEGVAVANAILDQTANNGFVTIQVFDPATGQRRRRVVLKEPTTVANPTFSADGKQLAIAQNNTLLLHDTKTGELTVRIPVEGVAAFSVAFAPDGRTLALSDLTDRIYVHNTADGKRVQQLKLKRAAATKVHYSPDGRFLVALPDSRVSRKGEASLWDVRAGKELYQWTHSFPRAASSAFSPDSKRVAFGGGRWGMVLRDIESGKDINHFSPFGGVYAMAFSPEGDIVAAASPWGAIRLWDTNTGKVLPLSADPEVQDFRRLYFSREGRRLGGDAGACVIWDTASGKELRRLVDPEELDFSFPKDMRCLVLSRDETLLAAAEQGGSIGLWDAASRKKIRVLKGQDSYIFDLAFCPDGQHLISKSSNQTVCVWNVMDGRELRRFRGQNPVAVSSDSRFLAVGNEAGSAICLYELATGKELKRFALHQGEITYQCAFSPDGRSVVAVGATRQRDPAGLVKVWNVADGELRYSLAGHKSSVWSGAFSPDGRTLATGAENGSLLLWELASGRPRHSLVGHTSTIHALIFSPDGRTLAASSVDAPVYLWDMATQQKPRSLSNDQLQSHWRSLAGDDAETAFRAIRGLTAAPDQTVAFIRENLKPVPKPDLPRVRQLVEALDSADFDTREKARQELAKRADSAAALLRQIMEKEKPSLEVRRTLQQILEAQETAPESLRVVRAVEVLEWIATTEANSLLAELANGAADARLTREASAVVKRLEQKKE